MFFTLIFGDNFFILAKCDRGESFSLEFTLFHHNVLI